MNYVFIFILFKRDMKGWMREWEGMGSLPQCLSEPSREAGPPSGSLLWVANKSQSRVSNPVTPSWDTGTLMARLKTPLQAYYHNNTRGLWGFANVSRDYEPSRENPLVCSVFTLSVTYASVYGQPEKAGASDSTKLRLWGQTGHFIPQSFLETRKEIIGYAQDSG